MPPINDGSTVSHRVSRDIAVTGVLQIPGGVGGGYQEPQFHCCAPDSGYPIGKENCNPEIVSTWDIGMPHVGPVQSITKASGRCVTSLTGLQPKQSGGPQSHEHALGLPIMGLLFEHQATYSGHSQPTQLATDQKSGSSHRSRRSLTSFDGCKRRRAHLIAHHSG